MGGVSVRLTGTDNSGNEVNFTTHTDLSGEFRIEGIGPGSYTVSQGQPTFLIEGPNVFGVEVSQSDDLAIEVSDQLIASSDNTFTERGLLPQFAMLEALSSFRGSGLLVVLDGDGLEWLQDRGGWDELQTVSITRDGNSLSIVGTDATGTQSTDISMSDRSKVQVIGRSGSSMMLRILGTSSDILSPAAVDAALAQ